MAKKEHPAVKEMVAKAVEYLKSPEGQETLEKIMKSEYGHMDPDSSACKRCMDSQMIRLCGDCPDAIRE